MTAEKQSPAKGDGGSALLGAMYVVASILYLVQIYVEFVNGTKHDDAWFAFSAAVAVAIALVAAIKRSKGWRVGVAALASLTVSTVVAVAAAVFIWLLYSPQSGSETAKWVTALLGPPVILWLGATRISRVAVPLGVALALAVYLWARPLPV